MKSCCGPKKHGNHAVSHWKWQRYSAIVLVPFSVWFMMELVTTLIGGSAADIAVWLHQPFVSCALAVLLIAGALHATLGVHEILTDYVHCPKGSRLFKGLVSIGMAALTIGAIGAICTLSSSAV